MSAQDEVGDAEIHALALVKRLARAHSSGADVVDCAALPASGSDFAAVLAWIADHAGMPEVMVFEAPRRVCTAGASASQAGPSRDPLRFVLPAGALA